MKKVYIAVLFVIFSAIIGFSAADEITGTDIAANILMGGQNIGEEFAVTLDQYNDVLESTVYSVESQGMAIDDYFDNQEVPSKVGLGYFTLVYLGNDQIVNYYAKENGLYPTDEEISLEVDKIYDENVTTDEVASQVIMNYGSIDAFKDIIRDSVLRDIVNTTVMENVVKQDEESLNEYFLQNLDALKSSYEMATASHILVETEEEALNVKNMIENGELSFTEAASEFSLDPGSKGSGGALGEFVRGQMVPEFSNAVFDAEIGVVTNPVQSDYGYHIILVQDKKAFDTLEEFMEFDAYQSFIYNYETGQFENWLVDYKKVNDFTVEVVIPEVKLYADFFKAAADPESLQAFFEELNNKVFVDGAVSEEATTFELVTYIQVSDMLEQSGTEMYNQVIWELYQRLPENLTVVQLVYSVYPDSPEVIVGYERMRLNDIEAILYDPQALQQYYNQYGDQLIDLIYYVLDSMTANLDKIIDTDALPEIQVKAIDLGLEGLEIYSMLTNDPNERILNFKAEIELLEKKLAMTGDESINEMINQVNILIEEAEASIVEPTPEATE